MKKLSFILSLAIASLAAHAETVTPAVFSENFRQMGLDNYFVTAPWTQYGLDVRPSLEDLDRYFIDDDGKVISYCLLQYGTATYALSNTNFDGGYDADQWLVSPEIAVDNNAMTLSFTTAFYNAKGAFGDLYECPFEILVSENGVAKENFNPVPVYKDVARASTTTDIGTKNYVVPLNGYAGKKINLAFVQKGCNCGPFGFTNIYLGNYYIELEDLTPKTISKGQQIYVDANVGIKTSEECPGIDVVVELNGETAVSEYVTKKNIGNTSKGVIYIRLTYDNLGAIGDDAVEYKISITPRMEGAQTSYTTGTIAVPVTSYPNNVVVEELTATGCQYCPIGTAAMEYYADALNTPNRGKFIGIALHGYVNYEDPMSRGIDEYRIKSELLMQAPGYPAANFNRSTFGQAPYNTNNATREYAKRSYNKVDIKNVYAPLSLDIEEAVGKDVVVEFDAYSAYAVKDPKISAAVVLIENDVEGYTDLYNQSNAFSKFDASIVTSSYNAPELVPYMKPFLFGGALAYGSIPFDKIKYNHVARGIYPEFYGETLTGWFEADKAHAVKMNFKVPSNVNILANTEVVVLLLDNETNAIIGSDIFPASKYLDNTAVNSVSADGFDVVGNGSVISVSAQAGSQVNIYTADGILTGSYVMNDSTLNVDASALKGIVIVTVDGKAKKLIF